MLCFRTQEFGLILGEIDNLITHSKLEKV